MENISLDGHLFSQSREGSKLLLGKHIMYAEVYPVMEQEKEWFKWTDFTWQSVVLGGQEHQTRVVEVLGGEHIQPEGRLWGGYC